MFSARGVTGGLLRAALLASTAAIAAPAIAGDIFVSDASQLSAAIGGAAPGDRIELQNDIALGTTLLPPVSANITIEGHGHTIDAQGNNRIFFLDSTATIQNVTLAGGKATGGDGGAGLGAGGGGGSGGGGADGNSGGDGGFGGCGGGGGRDTTRLVAPAVETGANIMQAAVLDSAAQCSCATAPASTSATVRSAAAA